MYGHKRVRERRNDALTRVGWEQLEVLIATRYRGQGYEVEHTGTAASGSKYDGGIDLKLRRPDEYVLVQVKHWNAYKVPHNDVHQLLGLMVNEGATGAILITSGEFTKAAIEAATRHGHVRLIDGNELRAMLGPLSEAATLHSVMRGRARKGEAIQLPAKAAFALLVMAFALFYVNRAVHSMSAVLRRPGNASAIGPYQQPLSARRVPSDPQAGLSRAELASDACHEVIDRPSGTYIDHCARMAAPRVPTAAEARESKRKADEAIKVLAPTTPEM